MILCLWVNLICSMLNQLRVERCQVSYTNLCQITRLLLKLDIKINHSRIPQNVLLVCNTEWLDSTQFTYRCHAVPLMTLPAALQLGSLHSDSVGRATGHTRAFSLTSRVAVAWFLRHLGSLPSGTSFLLFFNRAAGWLDGASSDVCELTRVIAWTSLCNTAAVL